MTTTYEITYHYCSTSGRRAGALRYHSLSADSQQAARFAFEDRFGGGKRSVRIVEISTKTAKAMAAHATRSAESLPHCPTTTVRSRMPDAQNTAA